MEKTLEMIAQDAIAVQDASNLRGVLLAWHRALCEKAVTRGGQVEEMLNVLYLSKVSSLLSAETDGIGSVSINDDGEHNTDFRMAYKWAKSVEERWERTP